MKKLEEEVISPTAIIGWHRTHSQDFIESLKARGFTPSMGSLYGPGLYATYELKSSLRPNMSGYGDYIIKYKINPTDFLIFDASVAKTVYGNKWKLEDQLAKIENKDFSQHDRQIRNKVKQYFVNIQKRVMQQNPEFAKEYNASSIDKKDIYIIDSRKRSSFTPESLSQPENTPSAWWAEVLDAIIKNIPVSDPNYALKNHIRDHFTQLKIWFEKDFVQTYTPDQDVYYCVVIKWDSEGDKSLVKNLADIQEYLKSVDMNTYYTSDWAQTFYDKYIRYDKLFSNIKGIVFTGRNDDHVIVSYRPNEAVPLGVYREVEYQEGVMTQERLVGIVDILTSAFSSDLKEIEEIAKEEQLDHLSLGFDIYDEYHSHLGQPFSQAKMNKILIFVRNTKNYKEEIWGNNSSILSRLVLIQLVKCLSFLNVGLKEGVDTIDSDIWDYVSNVLYENDVTDSRIEASGETRKKFMKVVGVEKDLLKYFSSRARLDKMGAEKGQDYKKWIDKR